MDDAPDPRLAPLRHDGHLLPGHGPLLRAAPGAPTRARKALARLWAQGVLVRLGAGLYVPLAHWCALAPWDRYTLACAGYALLHPAARFTGTTAAHLHGLPLAQTPPEIRLRSPAPGHRARRPLAASAFSDLADARVRRLPAPPAVRWTWNGVQAPADDGGELRRRRLASGGPEGEAPPPGPLPPVTVEAALSDGTLLGPVTVDALPTVQLALGSGPVFREAVVPLDGLRRRLPGPSAAWAERHADRLPTRAARERFERAWGFSDPRAESAGESLSRALIHELGFAAPHLQRTVFGRDGRAIGRTDFWWEEVDVVGEFDGIGKYDVDLHASAAERRQAITREKEREVALRRVCRDVARWTWADLREPAGLEAELVRAGVPRRR